VIKVTPLREERRLRLLRRMFGPKRDEVTGEWRKLHNGELYDMYSSPNIVRVIKSRIMRWAVHVGRIGERLVRGIGGETWGEGDHLRDPGVDGRLIFR